MDGVERGGRKWWNLKGRLSFKGMDCCGAKWGVSDMSVRESDDEEDHQHEREEVRGVGRQIPADNSLDPACVGQIPPVSGMNLATALAAERHFRAAHEGDGGNVATIATTEPTGSAPATPSRVSLMRLLEEGDGVDGGREAEKGVGGGGDGLCCVCMGRRKGAAFIPCGHTYCRVCSRELWLNRGSCPLCNRSILEILDIF